jgi:predicted unusual protein kinase regulating ubiquinone biosynthesis (AarF/ABC1/UbiB family)
MLPEEFAEPYRQSLTRLQDSAPPMPTSTVETVLIKNLGNDWQKQFIEFRHEHI